MSVPQLIKLPFTSDFGKTTDTPVIVEETSSPTASTSPLFNVRSGGQMIVKEGRGWTLQGDLPMGDKWQKIYAATARPEDTDSGIHPQNLFRLYTRQTFGDGSCSAVYRILKYNLSSSSERKESNGIFIFGRASQDGMNGYYAGLRVDGTYVIKRKRNGNYVTLAQDKFFSGVYNHDKNPCLLPLSTWIGIKLEIRARSNSQVTLTLWQDLYWTGEWKEVHTVVDDSPLMSVGYYALRTDFMDAQFDAFSII